MSAIALVGSITLLIPAERLRRISVPLVAFAAGSLLGGAFLHMLPAALGLVEFVYGLATIYLGEGVLERRVVPILMAITALALVTVWVAYTLRGRITHTKRFT